MALDDDAVQTDHARTIIAARIYPFAQRIDARPRREVAELAQRRPYKLLAHGINNQSRRAFHRFQRNIAGESIGDHDIDLVGKNIMSFDEADVVDIHGAQQIVRDLDHIVALDLLLADVEQADARLRVSALQIR